MTEMITELRARRRQRPFVPFVIVLKDGRRLPVDHSLQFGFNEFNVLVLDERDRVSFFPMAEIVELETAQPVA